MPCSLRIQRRAYSLPLYSPFYIVKDCWGEPWIIPSYRIFDVHTVDQPQLCEELPCIPVGFMVTYGMAKFISYDGHMSWPHVLASDSGTKAVGLCSAAWGWGKFCCLRAWDNGALWKACANIHMQGDPLGWWCLLSALRQPTTVLTSPIHSPETMLAPVASMIPDPWNFILTSQLMPCQDCLGQLNPPHEAKSRFWHGLCACCPTLLPISPYGCSGSKQHQRGTWAAQWV